MLLHPALGPHILDTYSGPQAAEIDVLQALDSLGVAEAVSQNGEVTVTGLAKLVGVNNLYIFDKQLKFGYLMDMFRQTANGNVANTGLSAVMPESIAWIELRLGKIFDQGVYETTNAIRSDRMAGAVYPVNQQTRRVEAETYGHS
ncbi:hypothetical protein JX266_005870 [Neoarthrinium moseri]|nr:hypothetical protein JX266_005870 [Neoarthrinium moseri]